MNARALRHTVVPRRRSLIAWLAIELLFSPTVLTHGEEPRPNLPPPPAASAQDQDVLISLAPVEIRAPAIGYAVHSTTTATKTDIPIREIPASIQAITRPVMDDQQALAPKDALKNISGAQVQSGYGNLFHMFYFRGFPNQGFTYRNGLLIAPRAYDLQNVDRLEVLKGPASVLYGQGTAGGTLNLITKTAEPVSSSALQQTVGSYSLYRTALDATGALDTAQHWLYRIDAAYQRSESFRDFLFLDRIFLAPSVTWRPSDRTEFNINVEYRPDRLRPDTGIVAVGNRPAPVPINRYLGDPTIGQDRYTDVLVETSASHRLQANWTVRQHFVMDRISYDFNDLLPLALLPDNRTLARGMWIGNDAYRHWYAGDVDLVGTFQAWDIDHSVLVGVNYTKADIRYNLATLLAPLPFAVPSIDIFNPTYGGINRPSTVPPNTLYTVKQSWTGLYAQDQITIAKRWHLLIGGRVDWMDTTTQLSTTAQPSPSATRHDRLFSPRVGFVYDITPQVSIYGNYARSFLGNFIWTSQPYAPETSRQYEGGIKASWWENHVTATLAVYEILKHNLLMADPNNPPLNIPVGEARSRGLEVDITGQVTPSLSLIAAFAYTDTRVTQDPTGNQNHRLPNVPLQSGSLWAKYAFLDGALRGLSLGAGVFLAAHRQGDVANSFQLPGYGRLDAMAAYRWPVAGLRMTAQINVNNLLNHRYYESSNINESPRLQIIPAAPLIAIGSLRIEY